jgi:glutathione S-transferase
MNILTAESRPSNTVRAATRKPMKLYFFVGACSLADHIVLEWLKVPYETVRMNHESIKTPEYLAINPAGTVPALVDGTLSLTENIAILGYLSDLYPDAQLLGDGTPRGRAEAMRWLGFLNSDVHGAFKPLFSPGRYLPDPAFAEAISDAARLRVRGYLDILDAQLNGRSWLTGHRTAADAYLFVMLRWAARLKVGITDYSNLLDFVERLQADEGVRTAIFDEESDVTK